MSLKTLRRLKLAKELELRRPAPPVSKFKIGQVLTWLIDPREYGPVIGVNVDHRSRIIYTLNLPRYGPTQAMELELKPHI